MKRATFWGLVFLLLIPSLVWGETHIYPSRTALPFATIGPDPLTVNSWLNITNATGAEKITNGAMGAATGWTVGADWTIGGGLATKAAGGVSTLSQTSANMVTPLVVGEVYLLVYTLDTTVTTGGLTPSGGGWTGTNQTADGTYREYFRASSTGALTFTPGNANLTCTLDNVSLKKVATQAADQVAAWVEDQGGTATKAGLYVRGEDGGVIGLAGEVLTFGSLDGDVTLTHSADTLTLAGGQLILPTGTTALPALALDNANTGFHAEGGSVYASIGGSWVLQFNSVSFDLVGRLALGSGNGPLLIRDEDNTILQLGVDSATPVAQTFKGADGVGTDIAGGVLALASGRGTGTGAPGVLYLDTSVVPKGTGSGSTQNPLIHRHVAGPHKTLTDAATPLFEQLVPSGGIVGGHITWLIEVSDGTDYQGLSGITTWAAVNKAGTVTSTITNVTAGDAKIVTAGTLTTSWTITNGTGKVTINVTPTGSLTETHYQIRYTVVNNGEGQITLL